MRKGMPLLLALSVLGCSNAKDPASNQGRVEAVVQTDGSLINLRVKNLSNTAICIPEPNLDAAGGYLQLESAFGAVEQSQFADANIARDSLIAFYLVPSRRTVILRFKTAGLRILPGRYTYRYSVSAFDCEMVSSNGRLRGEILLEGEGVISLKQP